jgi:acyl-homoserine-lactone acylase
VSAARRFAVVRVPLVAGDPTKYLIDGKVHSMTRTPVTIQVRGADGSLQPLTRTIYGTIHGPITGGVFGFPLFSWSKTEAYALRDPGSDNVRLINQVFEWMRSTSVRQTGATCTSPTAEPSPTSPTRTPLAATRRSAG